MSRIAVTGATGRLGGRVARLLAAEGAEQRLLVRDPSRAPSLPGAEVVRATYEDSAESRQALAGVDVLFMVSAAESADRLAQHLAFIDAAAAAGVRHVVYTSFVAAGPHATFTLARDHGATEDHLKTTGASSGMSHTLLRDNFYLDVFRFFADKSGTLRGPAGDGRVAAVAIADVARVAATVLQTPDEFAGQTLELTGPEALTLTEVAQTLARATGKPRQYVDETVEEAYASRAHYGVEQWQLDAWVSTYTAIAEGELAHVTDTVQRVTGTPAMSFAELLDRQLAGTY